jgi:hypothetical protein
MSTKRERTAGWVLPGLLSAGLVALFAFQAPFRAAESVLAGQTVAALAHTRTAAVPDRAVVFFNLGTHDALGLHITPERTSAFLIAPMVAVAAVMLRLRPAITRRILGAFVRVVAPRIGHVPAAAPGRRAR